MYRHMWRALAVSVATMVFAATGRAAPQTSSATHVAFKAAPLRNGPVKVGPPNGTLVVVGGGAQGPRIWKAFIDAAGGPDSLILDVPNNSIDKPMQTAPERAGKALRDHGARNVRVLFTQSRKVANSDAFTAIIKKAKGIWFDGGRQYHAMQAYGGTKTERAFKDLLKRGGVIGGSSAGAAVQGDFMVRGAPSHNNYIEGYPGSENGFGFLRDVAVDIHVVARERLPDLTSVIAWHPKLLGISADEGTAWVIHGDMGHIIGRGKAFAYNGQDTDPGRPYLTLYPGDTYNLDTRRVVSRGASKFPSLKPVVASLFNKYKAPEQGGATILVAEDGDILVDRAFGVPGQQRYMPKTTLPQFPLGDITKVFTSLCLQLPPSKKMRTKQYFSSPLEKCIKRISGPVGMHRTAAPPGDKEVLSDVDELYRFTLALQTPSTWPEADYSKGWIVDTFDGMKRFASYATTDGKRAALVRIPSREVAVVILTNDPSANARAMADRVLEKLFSTSK